MSAELPVVSFDCIAGPSDLISDGDSGFLIPMLDQKMFVEKLQVLIDDSSLREAMGKKSKELIQKFELNYICSEFESFMVSNTEDQNNGQQ